MKKNISLLILIFIISSSLLCAIVPFPLFSSHTNLTEANVYEINNFHETELSKSYSQTPLLLDLEWNKGLSNLVEIGSSFEVIDTKSDTSFFVTRTGGKNHADVEPSTNTDTQEFIYFQDCSWARRPVLVKLNETTYAPASLAFYPHGFKSLDTGLNGHLCLHFLGSKTDETNTTDFYHQKAIQKAKAYFKNEFNK